MIREIETRYGDINITRRDVKDRECWSLDFRGATGGSDPDETRLCEPGTFIASVVDFVDGETPVGEIRILWQGKEIVVVGAMTGREGIAEITPDHLIGAAQDTEYQDSLIEWLS